MGDIKADLMCCITVLNSLSDNFPHACSIISHNIATSTATSPYGSKDIHLFLENKQFLLKNNQCNDSCSPITLTACTKPSKSSNISTCGNPVCKRTGHMTEYCIKPGGGMARKTIEESNAACKLVLKKKTLGLKILITVKDMCIYGHGWFWIQYTHLTQNFLALLVIPFPLPPLRKWNMTVGLLLRRGQLLP